MTRPGIHLTRVREDGQGARLGLKPGDCLTDIGGNPVTTPETFAAALAAIASPTIAHLVRGHARYTVTLQHGTLDIAYAVTDVAIPEAAPQPLRTDAELAAERQARRAGMILTTAPGIDGHHATRQLGIVTAECVLGINLFADLLISLRDAIGGRSETAQKALRTARETCLEELKAEAATRGANAVIAVDLDYSEISKGNSSMILLVASGTAVVIAPNS